jgi:hypothetical protein
MKLTVVCQSCSLKRVSIINTFCSCMHVLDSALSGACGLEMSASVRLHLRSVNYCA